MKTLIPTRKRNYGALAVCAVLLLGLTACGDKATEPFKDAPRAGTNNSPARIVTNPDGFSNVAAKCDGPNMLYVAYHGDNAYAAITVVADDPRCVGAP
ncbi:hypothetical protein [Embleya sp. NPDC005971]|uniref:hypothetical protein n=1 Tax=Embleya sp. NPDC005971 TaxID=3156724 RepID=UPI0034012C60